jgi:hypothetical protein
MVRTIDLIVADPADEAAYVPALEAAGYALRTREPDWYQHRCLWNSSIQGCSQGKRKSRHEWILKG